MKTDIRYIVYINCKLFPFIVWIISGLKTMETRNKNTLKNLIGKAEYLKMLYGKIEHFVN